VTKYRLQDAGVILAPASVRYAKKQGQSMAKRRSSSGIHIKTNPPGSTTVIISLIVFILGVIGFVFPYTAILGQLSFWLCLAGYLLLLAGVLMKGL
jgi:VIT1/CCC1 family predicted Fe2+/Mn2+ transporter